MGILGFEFGGSLFFLVKFFIVKEFACSCSLVGCLYTLFKMFHHMAIYEFGRGVWSMPHYFPP